MKANEERCSLPRCTQSLIAGYDCAAETPTPCFDKENRLYFRPIGGDNGRFPLKRYVPFALTTLRLLLGPVALFCAFTNAPRIVYLGVLVLGTASDIFDGILARRFGIATQKLRRYDSATDAIYYAFILGVAWLLCKPVILAGIAAIATLVVSEAAVLAVSVVRFRRYPATHTYLAKFYGLGMLTALIALLVFNASGWVLDALATIAVIANPEIVAIHLLADEPPVDVRSLAAFRRRVLEEPEGRRESQLGQNVASSCNAVTRD